MTSAKLRGWGSYFSKKVDDTLSSLIPKPPQSNQQEADRLEANPQEANPQEANPQEANQPPSLGDACVRLGIALDTGDQHRRNQETRVASDTCVLQLRFIVFILWVVVISFIIRSLT